VTATGAEAPHGTEDRPCSEHLELHHVSVDEPAPQAGSRPFWIVAAVFTVILLGTTLPAPLYVVFQAQWGFSAGMLTVIFGAYSAGVLAALLLFGRLSDEIGRTTVLFAALAVAVASTVTFIVANGVATLLVARVLSGLSAGLTQGTATAALAELEPRHDLRRAGLTGAVVISGSVGLGPLLGGVFAQYLGWKPHLAFVAYLALLVLAAILLRGVPETVASRTRASLRVPRLSVPRAIRAAFLAAALAMFSAFAVIGLFVSLVPSFLGKDLHQHNHAVAGAVVFVFFACATGAQLALHGLLTRRAMLLGFAILAPGLVLVVLALAAKSEGLFAAATVCCGIGCGLVIMGALATVNRVAPPEHRAETLSTLFVGAYAGLAIPAICVGIVSEHTGFLPATLGCAIAIGVLLAVAARTILAAPAPPAAA
jgi:MFS family permease